MSRIDETETLRSAHDTVRAMYVRGNARLAVLVTAIVITLCGCGSGGDSLGRDDAATPEASTTPEPEPTATAEQVASVIAGHEADWREVVDQAGECRYTWVMGEGDPLEEAEGWSCYMREVTAGVSAGNAIKSLAELNAPDSMASLVDETNTVLQGLADIDLERACGRATAGNPNDTKACDRAMGNRMWAYGQLEDVLDKWGPYL